jgi:hypothetical protein
VALPSLGDAEGVQCDASFIHLVAEPFESLCGLGRTFSLIIDDRVDVLDDAEPRPPQLGEACNPSIQIIPWVIVSRVIVQARMALAWRAGDQDVQVFRVVADQVGLGVGLFPGCGFQNAGKVCLPGREIAHA